MPLSASTVSPESSATAGSPVCAAASRALISAFSAKVAPVSGTSGYAGTSPRPMTSTGTSGVQDPAQLVQLVRVAGGEDEVFTGPAQPAGSRRAARSRPPPGRAARPACRRSNGRALGGALHLDEVARCRCRPRSCRCRRRRPPRTRRSRRGSPSTTPTLTAATEVTSGSGRASALRARSQETASASATYAPVIAAVRVPPSACSTSQSIAIVFSPSALQVDRGPQRAADQPADLVRPAADPAADRLPVGAGVGGPRAASRTRPSPSRGRCPCASAAPPRSRWPRRAPWCRRTPPAPSPRHAAASAG